MRHALPGTPSAEIDVNDPFRDLDDISEDDSRVANYVIGVPKIRVRGTEALDDHGVVLAALSAADAVRIDRALPPGGSRDAFRAAITLSLPGVVPWPNSWRQCEAHFVQGDEHYECDRDRPHRGLHASRGEGTLEGPSFDELPVLAVWADGQCARRTAPIANWDALVAYAARLGYPGSLKDDVEGNGDGNDLAAIAGWRLDRLADAVDQWGRASGWEVPEADYEASDAEAEPVLEHVTPLPAGKDIRVTVSLGDARVYWSFEGPDRDGEVRQ
jgi:hypothetical protein